MGISRYYLKKMALITVCLLVATMSACSVKPSRTTTSPADKVKPQRATISLDGIWQVAEGSMEQIPAKFGHTVVVPGIMTRAVPTFSEVGKVSSQRQAFWYRKTFAVDGDISEVAYLKINKAKFGTKVYLNGAEVREHLPSFTPGFFDVQDLLKGNGKENELVVRVGANRESLPLHVPAGYDIEKQLYIPGIYDSVQLVLTGNPEIVRVQTVPDLANESVRVQTVIKNESGQPQKTWISWMVAEKKSGDVKGLKKQKDIVVPAGESITLDTVIPIDDVRHWSPDDPFLYNLKVSTRSDDTMIVFGMRSFRFNQDTGFGELNGKP